MPRLLVLLVAMLLSAVLYGAVFSVVERPLTIGDIPGILRTKIAYAKALPSPKLVVFAGSNGRYSHRCEAMAVQSGLPCANLSVAVGIGLDFQLQELLAV
jgi:hypothetical protein